MRKMGKMKKRPKMKKKGKVKWSKHLNNEQTKMKDFIDVEKVRGKWEESEYLLSKQ